MLPRHQNNLRYGMGIELGQITPLIFQILGRVSVSQYEEEDGSRPFASAPADLMAEVAMRIF